MKLFIFLLITLMGLGDYGDSPILFNQGIVIEEMGLELADSMAQSHQGSQLEKLLSNKSNQKKHYPRLIIIGGLISFYLSIFVQRFFYQQIEEKLGIELPFNHLSEILFWLMIVIVGLIGVMLLMIV